MQTEISPYNATEYRDVLARLALQRANMMHLVDLKRGGTPRVAQKCESAASPIGRSQFRSYPKVWPQARKPKSRSGGDESDAPASPYRRKRHLIQTINSISSQTIDFKGKCSIVPELWPEFFTSWTNSRGWSVAVYQQRRIGQHHAARSHIIKFQHDPRRALCLPPKTSVPGRTSRLRRGGQQEQ